MRASPETVSSSSIDMGAFADATRLRRWRDVVCSTFVQLECEVDDRAPFHGRIDALVAGPLHISRVTSSPQIVERTRARAAQSDGAVMLLSIQLKGRTILRQSGREAVLDPGCAAFYDSTVPYTLGMPGNFEQIVLHVSREILARHAATDAVRTAETARPSMPFTQSLLALGQQLLRGGPSEDAHLTERTAAVAVEMMALMMQTPTERGGGTSAQLTPASHESLVWRAQQMLTRHLGDANLSPGRLAQLVGVSLRRLQDAYHAHGTTASERIWATRLDLAVTLLTSEAYAAQSITAIAAMSGFNDFAHFSRRFKERFNSSPRAYRANARS